MAAIWHPLRPIEDGAPRVERDETVGAVPMGTVDCGAVRPGDVESSRCPSRNHAIDGSRRWPLDYQHPQCGGHVIAAVRPQAASEMKPFSKFILLVAALGVVALAIDYWNVTRKEKLLSSAVSQIGGRNGSIPAWPLGTEYRITLTAIPTPEQLDQLKIANKMRGWVGIAFEDCDLTVHDGDRLRRNLERCHLFVVQDGRMSPMADAKRTNHPMQPSGEVGRFEVDDQPSPPADR